MSNVTLMKGLDGKELTVEDIATYYTLNEQLKDIKKQVEGLKTKIKTIMETQDIDSLEAGDYVALLTDRVSKKLDEDLLAQVLVSKGIHQQTTTVKLIPDKNKVLQAIADGLMDQSEYDLCNKDSHSAVFNVKRKSK